MESEFWIGNREYFPGIPRIEYEGAESDNPLAFKAYDADRMVGNKTMREHLRFSICYWHTFCANGADPFGPGTRPLPWNASTDQLDAAKERLDAAFEFFSKMTVPYFCFHDRDLAPEGGNVIESEKKPAAASRNGQGTAAGDWNPLAVGYGEHVLAPALYERRID